MARIDVNSGEENHCSSVKARELPILDHLAKRNREAEEIVLNEYASGTCLTQKYLWTI
jgi:hypothetical protein